MMMHSCFPGMCEPGAKLYPWHMTRQAEHTMQQVRRQSVLHGIANFNRTNCSLVVQVDDVSSAHCL
eukprot:4914395-Amphidinium_carterae.1